MLKKNETKGKHLLNEVRDKEDPLYTPLTDFISLLAACQQQKLLFMEACKCTCYAKSVEDIKRENKPGPHILHLNLTLVSFPRAYIGDT